MQKKLFCKQKPLLKKAHAVAKGTGIVFIGTIIGTLLGFVSRIIIVRYITQTEYGIFSLALVLMSIFVTISMLGLQQGSTRYIACLLQRKERRKDF
jgi:O-antigen/teichoic acid export membrane protein